MDVDKSNGLMKDGKGKQRAVNSDDETGVEDGDASVHLSVSNHAEGNIVFVFVKEEGASDGHAAGKGSMEQPVISELSRSASPVVVKKAVTTSDSDGESSEGEATGGRKRVVSARSVRTRNDLSPVDGKRYRRIVGLSESDDDEEDKAMGLSESDQDDCKSGNVGNGDISDDDDDDDEI